MGWKVVWSDRMIPMYTSLGDAWGSFNSIMRWSTGMLFGFAVVWFGFPNLIRRTYFDI